MALSKKDKTDAPAAAAAASAGPAQNLPPQTAATAPQTASPTVVASGDAPGDGSTKTSRPPISWGETNTNALASLVVRLAKANFAADGVTKHVTSEQLLAAIAEHPVFEKAVQEDRIRWENVRLRINKINNALKEQGKVVPFTGKTQLPVVKLVGFSRNAGRKKSAIVVDTLPSDLFE